MLKRMTLVASLTVTLKEARKISLIIVQVKC